MATFVTIPQVICTCGKEIGSLRKKFDQLVASGETEMNALDRLGVTHIGCRSQILNNITHVLQPAQSGTVPSEILNPPGQFKTFALNQTLEEVHRGPPIEVKDLPGRILSAPKETIESIQGIEEPKSTIGKDAMMQSQYDVEGFSYDRKGNVRYVVVGEKYKIPILQITQKL